MRRTYTRPRAAASIVPPCPAGKRGRTSYYSQNHSHTFTPSSCYLYPSYVRVAQLYTREPAAMARLNVRENLAFAAMVVTLSLLPCQTIPLDSDNAISPEEATTTPTPEVTTPSPTARRWPGLECEPRGCVYSGAFGLTWRPEPCTTCYCEDGKEQCHSHGNCPALDCFGFPNITEPWACCPVCDFGVPNDECHAVPVRKQALYVALGDDQCQTEVLEYGCNNRVVFQEGKWYKCVSRSKKNKPAFLRNCNSDMVRKVVYRTNTCEAVEAEYHEIPQDYDPYPNRCI